ncbi:MAG: hypothetical protein AAGF75_07130 [Cyanobacteria bacterium P01_H01_bin.130]
MQNFGDMAQKALFLGIGLASYAGEKANETLNEISDRAQELADEMVARGEISAEEAKRMVDDAIQRAQEAVPGGVPSPDSSSPENRGPRPIEVIDITDEDDSGASSSGNPDVQTMRDEVQALEEELRRLKRDQ